MQIVHATPELSRAAQAITATGMAAHLVAQAVDLLDDAAVVGALRREGFGASSVKALRLYAAAIAIRLHVTSSMVH